MTGPEHYREAERRLAEAEDLPTEHTDLAMILAEAQVHATLALAAADALGITATMAPHLTDAAADWRNAISPAEAGTP